MDDTPRAKTLPAMMEGERTRANNQLATMGALLVMARNGVRNTQRTWEDVAAPLPVAEQRLLCDTLNDAEIALSAAIMEVRRMAHMVTSPNSFTPSQRGEE